jgi:hypothetical protein
MGKFPFAAHQPRSRIFVVVVAENVKPTGAQDAAAQAAGGEARVIGTGQDQFAAGAADVASGEAALRGNVANPQASAPQFTAG